MKAVLQLLSIVMLTQWLAACSSTGPQSSRVQAPSSSEQVQGEARIRAKAHTDLGFEYYAQNQYGVALQEAKVALKDDAGYTPTYNLLALVYLSLGDNKASEDAFMKARQLSPGDPEIANNYGWFLCQTKREQQSFLLFADALQNPLYPTPLVALSNYAECALKVRDYKTAEEQLQRALNMAPNNSRALLLMTNLKYQQKKYGEARFYVNELHRNTEPNATSVSLAYRIARVAGNREDEARYLALMRKKFADSDEYKKLQQGVLE